MPKDVMLLFSIAFALFLMQSIGGYFQIKDYKKTIRRIRQKGNVGIGQKRGRLLSGHIVMIACDNDGIVTSGEILDGITFLSKFHSINKILDRNLVGISIYDLLNLFRSLDKKEQKKYTGYIRSLEALEQRLLGN